MWWKIFYAPKIYLCALCVPFLFLYVDEKYLLDHSSRLNFSLWFIPSLEMVTAALRLLSKKGSKYQWLADYAQSFENIKQLITTARIFTFPDFSKVFCLQTYASNYVISVILLQQNDNDNWWQIPYINRALTKSELNYSTTKKEFLEIVWAFLKSHPCLHGTLLQVETDHLPLVSLI